jgi:hypothetical protein
MKFSNPVFHPGVNVTVREGSKWLRKVGPGREFMVGDRRAMCHFLHNCRFNSIPPSMLSYEHDPACRNIRGLYDVMTRLYKKFNQNSVVTLVGFEVLNDQVD